MIAIKFKSYLIAGICFACAAAIPVVVYFILFRGEALPITSGSPILSALTPILIAAFFGSLLGVDILDPEQVKSGWRAAFRGIGIALLSYLLFIVLSAIIVAVPSGDVVGVIVFYIFVFFYGLLFVGWLIVVVGAGAGVLLYLLRLKIIGVNTKP
jgi:hypothetical protein